MKFVRSALAVGACLAAIAPPIEAQDCEDCGKPLEVLLEDCQGLPQHPMEIWLQCFGEKLFNFITCKVAYCEEWQGGLLIQEASDPGLGLGVFERELVLGEPMSVTVSGSAGLSQEAHAVELYALLPDGNGVGEWRLLDVDFPAPGQQTYQLDFVTTKIPEASVASWLSTGMVALARDVSGAEIALDLVLTPVSQGPWENLGFSLDGTLGPPRLTGTGALADGSMTVITLDLAAQNALSMFFLSVTSIPTPFKGGMLAAVPPAISVFLPTGPTGSIALPFPYPAGLAGIDLFYQYAIQDPAAPNNVSISNAIKGTGSGEAPPPVISSFAPSSGGVGTIITLSGSGFTGRQGEFDERDYCVQIRDQHGVLRGLTKPTSITSNSLSVTIENVRGASFDGQIVVTRGDGNLVNFVPPAPFTNSGPSWLWTGVPGDSIPVAGTFSANAAAPESSATKTFVGSVNADGDVEVVLELADICPANAQFSIFGDIGLVSGTTPVGGFEFDGEPLENPVPLAALDCANALRAELEYFAELETGEDVIAYVTPDPDMDYAYAIIVEPPAGDAWLIDGTYITVEVTGDTRSCTAYAVGDLDPFGDISITANPAGGGAVLIGLFAYAEGVTGSKGIFVVDGVTLLPTDNEAVRTIKLCTEIELAAAAAFGEAVDCRLVGDQLVVSPPAGMPWDTWDWFEARTMVCP